MNERIRLLALQAGMNPNEPVMDYDRKETHWNGWSTAMEKFAELILRDVHQYVDGLDTAQVISNGILRRYGMEE